MRNPFLSFIIHSEYDCLYVECVKHGHRHTHSHYMDGFVESLQSTRDYTDLPIAHDKEMKKLRNKN